jgi:hypothetical protein
MLLFLIYLFPYLFYVEPSFPDKLITILARPDLPDNVSARWIARQMQRPWRDVGKHVLGVAEGAEGDGGVGMDV